VLYIEFDNMLASVSDQAANASESHGNLIGLFSARPESAINEWLAALTKDAGVDSAIVGAELGETAQHMVSVLAAGDPTFQLMLPDDESELSERVEALAHWCQGYMYGLAQGGVVKFDGLPGDCAEILQDFSELTNARSEDDGDSAERDFFELSEYVRVGAQLLYEELTEVATAAAPQQH